MIPRYLIVVAIVCLSCWSAKPASAQHNGASVGMGSFTNTGSLSAIADFITTISGVDIYGSAPAYAGAKAFYNRGAGETVTASGKTYAMLMNNTSSAVSLTASLQISAWGECAEAGSATSTISLGSTTATGSCSYPDDPNDDAKTQQFIIVNLQPNMYVEMEGTWSVEAVNAGEGS